MELQGPLWAPKRLFPNLITLAFVLIVPILYGTIYSFRRKHATTMLGLYAIKFQHVAVLAKLVLLFVANLLICTKTKIAVSGPTEHCPIFHFPPSVRPFVLCHRRDISTFLDILTVYTMKTIYFLNAYHLGW